MRVRIEPDRVQAAVQRRRMGARPRRFEVSGADRATTVLPIEFTVARADSSIESLGHALDEALVELAETASLRGSGMQVELADSLIHLDVVAGDFAAESARQLQLIAAACVSELLGEAAADHETRWQLQPDEKHLLIAAVPRALIQAVAEAAQRHKMTLASVQPDLCVQWNQHTRHLHSNAFVFGSACGREAVVASVDAGTITALSGGAWLDRHDASHASDGLVDHLFALVDQRDLSKVLDDRVDRLLASAAQDATQQAAYVLVVPPGSTQSLSPRWTARQRGGPAA